MLQLNLLMLKLKLLDINLEELETYRFSYLDCLNFLLKIYAQQPDI